MRFDGRTYDCGSKIGFLAANLAFALEREDLGPQLRAEMTTMGLKARSPLPTSWGGATIPCLLRRDANLI